MVTARPPAGRLARHRFGWGINYTTAGGVWMSYYPGTASSGQSPGTPTSYSTSSTIQPGTFAAVTAGANGVTITLASATGVYRIKKVDTGAGAVTIAGPTGAKFDGQSNWAITTQYQSNDFTGDGTNLHVT